MMMHKEGGASIKVSIENLLPSERFELVRLAARQEFLFNAAQPFSAMVHFCHVHFVESEAHIFTYSVFLNHFSKT